MSTFERLPEAVGDTVSGTLLSVGRRWAWAVPAVIAGLCVYAAYLLTHPYPAFGAGLFLRMAERAAESAPALPRTVHGYTNDGVPFAYPPLMFYVAGAVMAATGVDGITLARHLPHLVSVAALVPFYLFAEELLADRRGAGLATLLVATTPPILQWQISAGGLVRAPAYLFTVVGLHAGLKLFREGDYRWLPPALGAFALTVLSHPVYTVFFVLSYLCLYAAFDRSLVGLGRGGAVGFGGAVLSAPWWVQVVAAHGFDVLTGAAGTHGGIGRQIPDLFVLFTAPEPGMTRAVLFSVHPELFEFDTFGMAIVTVWSVAIVAALLGLVYVDRRWSFLPAWFLVTLLLVSKPRFSFLIGALMVGAVANRTVISRVHLAAGQDGAVDLGGRRNLLAAGLAVLVFVATTGVGVTYGASMLDSHAGSTSQPQFIDSRDVEAMQWAANATEPDAEFVVVGDAAEWFPYYTDRTILVGPWGVEWRGRERYESQLQRFNQVSTCGTASCLTHRLRAGGVEPDYVYVPRDRYTVRGMEVTPPPELAETLERSSRYHLVYRNPGVSVFAYEAPRAPDPPGRPEGGSSGPDPPPAGPGPTVS